MSGGVSGKAKGSQKHKKPASKKKSTNQNHTKAKKKPGDQNGRKNKNSHSDKQNKQQQNKSHSQSGQSKFNSSSTASFMKQAFGQMIGTIAAKNTSLLGDPNDRTASGNAGEFDLYLFAQSWAPRFCCISPEKCTKEKMESLNDLSPHGLWPAYQKPDKNDRTYPAFCQSFEQFSGDSVREIHEWKKHGTCTGLSPEVYFQEEERIQLELRKKLLQESPGAALSVDSLVKEFGGPTKVALKADKHCRLEEITTCWSKLPDGSVGEQVDCPDHVLASARNSAVIYSNCNSVWLDSAGSCRFINKQMRNFLKTGEEAEKMNNN